MDWSEGKKPRFKGDALASPFVSLFSSAPAAAPLLVHVELGQLAVGAGHELLELVLKAGGAPGLGGLGYKAAARAGAVARLRTAVSVRPGPSGPGAGAALRAGRRASSARERREGGLAFPSLPRA